MARQFCTECGAKLKPNATFCADCGAPVRGATNRPRGRQAPGRAGAARAGRPVAAVLLVAAGAVLVLLAGVVAASMLSAPAAQTSAGPAAAQVVRATPTPLIGADKATLAIPYPEVPRIAPKDAKALADSGKAVLVDVRTQEEYAKGHMAGAVSVPLTSLNQHYQELPRNQEIIAYCT